MRLFHTVLPCFALVLTSFELIIITIYINNDFARLKSRAEETVEAKLWDEEEFDLNVRTHKLIKHVTSLLVYNR